MLYLAEEVGAGTPSDAEPAAPDDVAALARTALQRRRLRDATFPAGLFADPAWDILLDLLVAAEENRAVSVSSVCIASAAPPATALRYLRKLEQLRLVRRWPDPKDARRAYVALSDDGYEKVRHAMTLGAMPHH